MNYKMAHVAYKAVGRRIYNATKGGKLEEFPRVEYDTLFALQSDPCAYTPQSKHASQTAAMPTILATTDPQPMDNTEGSVRYANLLFREKKYAESIPYYLAAARRIGSKSLEFNARLALRRLGFADKEISDKILEQIS